MNQLQKDLKIILTEFHKCRGLLTGEQYNALERLEWYIEQDLNYETYTGENLE